MKTEEILRRAAEYHSVREALGVYLVELAVPSLKQPANHNEGLMSGIESPMSDTSPTEPKSAGE